MSEGVLLLNLGTPDSPAVGDVRKYLNEFLMDPYVIDAPWAVRRLLVSCVILPFRPKQSAEAYASIWRSEGSPLLIHSRELADQVAHSLNLPVELAMRYGSPSIEDAVRRLAASGVSRCLLVPLYPQYAESTCRTSIEAVQRMLPDSMALQVLPVFYDDPDYLRILARQVKENLPAQWDHLLLSYHGLPERHLTKADPTGAHCLQVDDCCNKPSPAHATCYRHQCLRTSNLLAEALELEPDRWSFSFQSRLGRLPWLTPYTDQVLQELPARGVRHLAVACPAFVADNLETLEEIQIQGEETFRDAGGETLTLVPCLNADSEWADLLARWCRSHLTDNAAAPVRLTGRA